MIMEIIRCYIEHKVDTNALALPTVRAWVCSPAVHNFRNKGDHTGR